jgi:hypothetical protein
LSRKALITSAMCVHFSVCPSALIYRLSWHLILGAFMKIWHESPNLVKIGQKYCALYMKTWVGFIVVDDIKSSQTHSFRPKLYRDIRPSVRPFFHMFVSPHVSTRIPPDRFTWNFILRNFMKICWGFLPHLVEIGPKLSGTLLHVMTQVGLLLPVTLNRHKSPLLESNGMRLLGEPRRYSDTSANEDNSFRDRIR